MKKTQKFQTIGNDISLLTCVDEGYGMIRWPLDMTIQEADQDGNAEIDYIETQPHAGVSGPDLFMVAYTSVGIQEMVDEYVERKPEIDDYIGSIFSQNVHDYTPHDLCHLCFTLNQYAGIFNQTSYALAERPKLWLLNLIGEVGEQLPASDAEYVGNLEACPYCRSTNVYALDDGNFNTEDLGRRMTCNICDKVWVEKWKMIGYTDEADEADEAAVDSDFTMSDEAMRAICDDCDDTAGYLFKESTLRYFIEREVNRDRQVRSLG